MDVAAEFIRARILNGAEEKIRNRSRDNKTELQELVQQESGGSVRYEMTGESGPDHNKRFFCVCWVNGLPSGEGEGHSKKEAEQAAAGAALRRLQP